MECSHWNETWVAYLYDECSPEERETIEAHLDGCDACHSQMNELAATRQALKSGAPEIVAPPRVIVLPAAAPRATNAWSFAGGFAAAAALFAIGIFIGMTFFASERVILQADGDIPAEGIAEAAANRVEPTPDPAYLQIRDEYEQLENRLGRIENWLPERHGETMPALATMDRVQTEVGKVHDQFDLRRAEDLRFVVEWILATDQESRLRDARTLQTLGIVHAENNPNVRQR